MGIPLVKTKLLAYALGAAFGGIAGAFLGAYTTLIDAGEFQFGFSIFVLSMVILGGLGSIWGVVLGALLLANINYYLIPDVLNGLPGDFGLNFNLTELQVSIFGFLLVLVMVLRPQGLIPERRRKLELTRGIGELELEEPGTAWSAVEPGERRRERPGAARRGRVLGRRDPQRRAGIQGVRRPACGE